MVRERAKRLGERNDDDEERKRLVNEVRWADNDYGNPNLKELKQIVVTSSTLYAGFVADCANRVETKSRGLSEGKLDSAFPSGHMPAFEHGARHTDKTLLKTRQID